MQYPLEDRASETSLKLLHVAIFQTASALQEVRAYRMHGKLVQWPREF